MRLRKIISGGQTGADRGGLDAALQLGLEIGGWCPPGRLAEDGQVPQRYKLVEAGKPGYRERTFLNVRDSDATMIVTQTQHTTTGSALTFKFCRQMRRPCIHIVLTPHRLNDCVTQLSDWLVRKDPVTLNVAGSRESKANGLQRDVCDLLVEAVAIARDKTQPTLFPGWNDSQSG